MGLRDRILDYIAKVFMPVPDHPARGGMTGELTDGDETEDGGESEDTAERPTDADRPAGADAPETTDETG
jgi:hypothetical protein